MGWTKVQQIAQDKGVSERAVYKMLAKYREEIGEEHIHKDGNNGTFLDETAVSLLSEKMRSRQSVVVYDEEQDEARKQLIKENAELRGKLEAAMQLIIDKSEALEEAQKKQIETQQQMLQIAEDNAAALREIEEARKEAEKMTAERIAEEQKKTEEAKGEAEELRAEITRLKNRSLWERIRNK